MTECKTIADRKRELGPLCDELSRKIASDTVREMDAQPEYYVRQSGRTLFVEFSPEIEAELIGSGTWCCCAVLDAFLRHARGLHKYYDVLPEQLARIRATYNYKPPPATGAHWEVHMVEMHFLEGYLNYCNGRTVREMIQVASSFWNGYLRTRFVPSPHTELHDG